VAIGKALPLKSKSKCWCGDPDCCRVAEPERAGAFRFELWALAVLGALFLVLLSGGFVEPQELYAAWFMPFLGIAAATIAMSTPAGGGVVFFPTMVLLGVPPFQAVAFSVGAQSVGMGIFGTFNWVKRDRSAILFPAVVATVLIGSAATLLALLVFPVAEAEPLQLTFSFFGVGLATYIFYSLRHGLDKETRRFQWSVWTLVAVTIVGLIGGLFVGYIGAGIDALLFFVLTSRFKVDSHQATVTSIVTMGLTAMVPFGVHLFVIGDVPVNLWLMVLPGILMGARIGPWLNKTLGKRRILIGFGSLLVIEFLMTFTKFVVLR
jgi:uncharacterized membrane protein YfcA